MADSAFPTAPESVQPHPALTQDQSDTAPSPSTLSEAVLHALLGEQERRETAEVVAIPPAEPANNSAAPTASQPEPGSTNNLIVRSGGTGGDRFAINIRDADIREVLDLLSKEGSLNILASPKVQGKVSATLNNVSLQSALDAILKSTGFVSQREEQFIFVGLPTDFVQMAQSADEINTRIYHPNYVTSAELKNLITPVLTQGVGVISVTSESQSGIPSNITDAGGHGYAGGDALLVRDYEAVLREVDQLVAEVDLRPLQIHIEAMILSVKLNDENKFGVNFQLFRQHDDMKFGWGTMPASLTELKFDGGLKLGFLDSSLGSFINALEKVGDTNVIATPRLMVVNKHAAEIQIGKEEGYVNTTQTETAATQTVEMLQLGTILRIRPFVANDGMIRLEVHPEISDGGVTVEEGFTLPHKEITQVTTNIMVRDGCTAVIGGLIQDEQTANRTQIPLLGSLPVVGFVFREKDETLDRHEIIVLLTPNIVQEKPAYREGAVQAAEFQRRQSTFAEKMCPIAKRSLARKYIRRAKTAWSKKDRKEALRMAELAVHFDPVNREAIELRSDIWLGKPCEPIGAMQPDAGDHAPVIDGPQLPPWVLQRLGDPAGSTPPEAVDAPEGMDLPLTPGNNPNSLPGEMNGQAPSSSTGPTGAELNLDPPGTVTVLPPPSRQGGAAPRPSPVPMSSP
ncbi:MAG TPA: secretin and TonB N-terminal domain-containing protein [Thermoguttaceae bacterium]|nr:secretin and TonB N-terminal domain-containing protein [Thermoguttaceae bacterium]